MNGFFYPSTRTVAFINTISLITQRVSSPGFKGKPIFLGQGSWPRPFYFFNDVPIHPLSLLLTRQAGLPPQRNPEGNFWGISAPQLPPTWLASDGVGPKRMACRPQAGRLQPGSATRRRGTTDGLARLVHELSAATADTPLQRAVSPLSRSTYYREYVSLLHGSERPFRGRLRGFATNLHE